MTYYFQQAFGVAGDLSAIPVTAQPDGAISYNEGYGPNYSAPRDSDPDALTITRNQFNQLMYAITGNIQQYQQHGVPEFITTADNGGVAYQYAKGAQVRYDNGSSIENYVSKIDANATLPTVTANWTLLRTDPAYLGVSNSFSVFQTISSAGSQLFLNSTDSTALKLIMRDNGTARGGIGANSTFVLAAYLSNLTTIAGGWDTGGNFLPGAAATYDIGSSSAQFRNVFANRFTVLGNTAPTNGIFLPASDTLGFAIGSAEELRLTATALSPSTSDGNALGTATLMWSDAFFAAGGVLNWNNGNATITHSTGLLTANVPITATGFNGPVTGNASTATALATARNIGGVGFDGTASIVPQTIQTVDDTSDTTCFLLFANASGAQSQQPKTNSSLGFNASTGGLSATSFAGAGTGLTGTAAALNIGGNAATATALQTPRAIGIAGSTGLTATGVNFDGSGAINPALTGTLLPANGGTGFASYAVGDLLYASTTSALSKLADVAAGSYLRSGGISTAPAWSAVTLPNSATAGDLIYASATNTYANLADVATGRVLTSGGVGVAPAWSAAPTLDSIAFATTSGIIGTTTNNNATAGSVGEVISSNIAIGSAVSLANNTIVNVTSITLTPGDWDVSANLFFTINAATILTNLIGLISDTSATGNNGLGTGGGQGWNGSITGAAPAISLGSNRITVAAATTKTIYLMAFGSFTVNTLASYGFIWARRAR